MTKRILALVLALAAAASGAFAQKAEWLSKQPMPVSKEKVAFKIFVPQRPEIEDITRNWFTSWYEAKTNVHVDWQLAPNETSALRQKLNLVIAAGDLPDAFLMANIDANLETRYGVDEGLFLPLNELIDKHMPNLKAYLAKNPGVRGMMTAIDGKIYGLPNVNECYHCGLSQKMWINKAWLDKLGLKAPTTTEEFYQVLKAFKEKDPNGNGKRDEIALMGCTDSWQSYVDSFLMCSFVLDTGMQYSFGNTEVRMYYDAKTGKVMSIYDRPEYKEGLKYLRRLYAEGLIYSGSFTQKQDQFKQIIAAEPGVVGAFPNGASVVVLDPVAQSALYRQYVALAPLKGPAGLRQSPYYYDGVAGINRLVISKSCKDPVALVKWADAMYSHEIQQYRAWGELGKSWRWAAAGEKGLDGKDAIWANLVPYSADPQSLNWQQLGIEFQSAENRFGQATKQGVDLYSAEGLETMLMKATKELYEPYAGKSQLIVPKALRFSTAEADEIQTLLVELNRYAVDRKMAYVMGGADIDKEWASYVKKLNDLGLQKFLAIQQKAYDRQFGKK
ncbi:MAG TPA: extracellular solute-binding protein [Spirochaetales bacterium]|nr:extracellular solute-binding protein [Spirochaetales bacterium]HRY55289.1 extracellular solute-binding protein [Spirochaetia bacterium]HRZ63623.1 extracellular solute-binding protein [Spirochaetia bacterium]